MLTAAAAGLSSGCRAAVADDQVSPEAFGAKGDGRTNDTTAFAAMSAHVNARGGGTIVLRPVTYIVGEQRPTPRDRRLSFTAGDIIHLAGCKGPVRIRGNGARLRCADGLRYGRFDPHSGNPLPMPARVDVTNQAMPYYAMIFVERCSGSVDIEDLELDGNVERLRIGGKVARNSWEGGASGIRLYENRGPERLSKIHSHHHAQDGIMLAPASDRAGTTTATEIVSEFNGRQGCSIIGGRNFVFDRCSFRRTGRSVIQSAPGAGVDIEQERSPIRNVSFTQCEFSDNWGFGAVAGDGDAADISFANCRFVGTTNYAVCPNRPLMRFQDCLFAGAVNYIYADADPARAAQFASCTFTDDAALSPTGRVFLGRGSAKWIAVMDRPNANARFSGCHFRLVGEGRLPLSTVGVTYADCDMAQRSPGISRPLGTYLGRNIIRGNAHLEGAIIRGEVTLNGRLLPRTG